MKARDKTAKTCGMSLIPEPPPNSMLVISRATGQSFIVDDTIVFTLAEVRTIGATLIRKPPGSLGVAVDIDVDGLREIAPGISARYFPSRPGSARIGVVAATATKIRRLPSPVATEDFPRQ